MLFVVKKAYPTEPEKDWEKHFDNFSLADDEYVAQAKGHEGGEATLTIAIRVSDGHDELVEERRLL